MTERETFIKDFLDCKCFGMHVVLISSILCDINDLDLSPSYTFIRNKTNFERTSVIFQNTKELSALPFFVLLSDIVLGAECVYKSF